MCLNLWNCNRIETPTSNLGFLIKVSLMNHESVSRQLQQLLLTTPGNGNVAVLSLIVPLPVAHRCRNHSLKLLQSSLWSKIPDLSLEFQRLSVIVSDRDISIDLFPASRDISGRRSSMLWSENTFLDLAVIENSRFAAGISTIPIILSAI